MAVSLIKKLAIGYLLFLLTSCYGLPTKQSASQIESKPTQIESEPNIAKLVIIRPYNYYYFGHSVEVLINNVSRVSLPNQSYTTLISSPGKLEIRGQSGLLGPPTSDTFIEAKAGEVIYLLWGTKVEANYSTGIPIVNLSWHKITKEQGNTYLSDVNFKAPKNVSNNN